MSDADWSRLGKYLVRQNMDNITLSYEEVLKITNSKARKTLFDHKEFFGDKNRSVFNSIFDSGFDYKNDFYNKQITFYKTK